MTRYMLDTNMASNMADLPRGPVERRIRRIGLDTVCISVITVGELLYGGLKRGSRRLQASLEAIIGEITIEPMTVAVGNRYAEVRHNLTRRGLIIGPNDLWIAAHAITLDCTLVTANTGEFSRVPDLRLQNWLVD